METNETRKGKYSKKKFKRKKNSKNERVKNKKKKKLIKLHSGLRRAPTEDFGHPRRTSQWPSATH
jgi:hypothetical protein